MDFSQGEYKRDIILGKLVVKGKPVFYSVLPLQDNRMAVVKELLLETLFYKPTKL